MKEKQNVTRVVRVVVRRNAYVDSVSLLQVTSEVAALERVSEAALVMATDLNRELLAQSGFLMGDAVTAGANDLVIAVAATDEASANAAQAEAQALLTRRRTAPGATTHTLPRSLRSARRADPEATLAVISVPGQFAAAEARLALSEGLHVFLFSDNVPIEDEVDLKRRARERSLLVMGPDCGTAIIDGVGLGFANVVRRGPVGLVGASGTGIQEVVCLLHQAGAGVSHAIGTGSRDLSAAVGGATTLQAIDLLARDQQTETIVLVSKPSAAAVAGRVLAALAATGKRAVAYLQGAAMNDVPAQVEVATSLEAAARLAASDQATWPTADTSDLPSFVGQSGQRGIRGLYCGGTLCAEAAAVVSATHASNPSAHRFVDFGDDQYTRGRAHPMLDPTLRNQAIVQAGGDPTVAVLLLDFVLGLGTHLDPAGATVPAIREALAGATRDGRHLAVLAHLVGTDRDPQDVRRQEMTLREAGVVLFPSNYQLAVAAKQLAGGIAV